MSRTPEVGALFGRRVCLEPLDVSHVEELVSAALEDRTTYGLTTVPHDASSMTRHFEGLLRDYEAGLVVPFTQVDLASGRRVGMTRYLTIRSRPGEGVPFAVEIGGTWLAASAQRTGLNTEAKYLLLRHAFEHWRVARVDFKTDSRNERSRAAIARVGASFEGVLRHWQPSQVTGEEKLYRDSAMFSIIDTHWPDVRVRLESMIASSESP
jgi:RimJ/RimL family protein N-acetyltransferase